MITFETKKIKNLFFPNNTIKNTQIYDTSLKNENYSKICYPVSKEWFNITYSFNKVYNILAINTHAVVNTLFKSYSNMLENNVKSLFKHRRHYRARYSANKIYTSRPELKHKNAYISIMVYAYNKQKLTFQKWFKFASVCSNYFMLGIFTKSNYFFSKINKNLFSLVKNNISIYKEWNRIFFIKTETILRYSMSQIKRGIASKLYKYLRKVFNYQINLINCIKDIHFNLLKWISFQVNLGNLGLKSLLDKLYNKITTITIINLKSLYLNSDVFLSAISLKLSDRTNKAIRVLIKAVQCMTIVPYLHTLITYYAHYNTTYYVDNNSSEKNMALVYEKDLSLDKKNVLLNEINKKKVIKKDVTIIKDISQKVNKDKIINTTNHQIVCGVRIQAAGRLTRRLIAMRAVSKLRYIGTLQNIFSSFMNESSTMFRGFLKSSLQYTLINHKTRNGTFGGKMWVNSH